MNAIALPHVAEARSRRTHVRRVLIAVVAGAAAGMAAFGAVLAPHLPFAALALAPRVVPL